MMSFIGLKNYLDEVKQLLHPEMERTLLNHNKSDILHEAMSYSLMDGGKRIRAALCMMTCEAMGLDREKALAAAIGLECIHAYSLIHDDLPSMDDDDMRRGKPSNHKVYGDAMAILAGDALQGMAFLKLSESYPGSLATRLTNLLSSAAVKMVAGQSLDISVDQLNQEESLERMHRLKTGALFKAAVLMGAACGGLEDSDPRWKKLEIYSKKIGLAFQISDDILDVTGSDDLLGKTAGKDTANNKMTYVSLLGIQKAKEKLKLVVQEARDALDKFSDTGDSLKAVATFIENRDH
jgi:geranylgeranyl diphosphate synthase type II